MSKIPTTKCKYWTSILYLDSLPSDWQVTISNILQIPFCYCIHDKDLTKDGDSRKPHVHIVLAFNNTTTYNHVLTTIQLVSPTTSIVKQVINIRYIYNYLIHDTDDAKKQGKFLYSSDDRICCNDFDIGNYEQLSLSDKHKIIKEICDFIVNNDICNFSDFYLNLIQHYDNNYLDIVIAYSGLFERLTRGNYLRHKGS